MHTVGDGAGRQGREPEGPEPYLEDLPAGLWNTDEQVPPSSSAGHGRSRRQRRWRRPVLPVVAALGLVVALVLAVPVLEDTDAGARDAAAPGEPALPAMASIGDNPFLASGVRPATVKCVLPEFSSDRQRLRDFYRAGLRCLDRAWRPALTEAGVPFEPARLRIVDEPTTACGPLPPVAEATGLYCAEDTTIYLPRTRTLDAFGLTVEAHVATLAHEYGHHVQHLSGVLGEAGSTLGRYAPGSPRDKELGRRVELQANCFAGMFLGSAGGRGSFDAELAEAAVDDFRHWVDSDTHGSSETQRAWALRGYRGTDVGSCNTWHASAETIG